METTGVVTGAAGGQGHSYGGRPAQRRRGRQRWALLRVRLASAGARSSVTASAEMAAQLPDLGSPLTPQLVNPQTDPGDLRCQMWAARRRGRAHGSFPYPSRAVFTLLNG